MLNFCEKIPFLIQDEQTMKEFVNSCSKIHSLVDCKNCINMQFLKSISGFLSLSRLGGGLVGPQQA